MDLPVDLDDALAIAAHAEALGPALPGIIQQAAIHDALTGPGQFLSVLEYVLPIARAAVILAHALNEADSAIAEREQLIQQFRTLINRKAAQEGVRPVYEEPNPHTVAWTGSSASYFENMGAVNKELAKSIVEMARRDQEAQEPSIDVPDAIETTESGRNQPNIDELEPPE